MRPPHGTALVAIALVVFTVIPVLQPRVDAQLPDAPDGRYAGLQWRFVRIKYHYVGEGSQTQQFAMAFNEMRRAYREGAMLYGMFSARKP